jgi:ABC-type lipoprotein export system ATPase subunit
MALLELNHVTKSYASRFSPIKKTALDDFSTTMDSGEFTAIMGPSGAGKTTLLNLVATIDTCTSGEIVFQGTDVSSLSGDALAAFRRDNLGFIFQEHRLLETLTIRENIILPLALQRRAHTRRRSRRAGLDGARPPSSDRLSTEAVEDRVIELAQILGIEDILDKYPVENSGGQKQRAAVARALAGSPGLVLADEPTGSLDSVNARQLMQTLAELNEQAGATILLVTHDPLVASYSRRIVFIRDGKLFTELRRSDGRDRLYHEIVDVLSALEGARA